MTDLEVPNLREDFPIGYLDARTSYAISVHNVFHSLRLRRRCVRGLDLSYHIPADVSHQTLRVHFELTDLQRAPPCLALCPLSHVATCPFSFARNVRTKWHHQHQSIQRRHRLQTTLRRSCQPLYALRPVSHENCHGMSLEYVCSLLASSLQMFGLDVENRSRSNDSRTPVIWLGEESERLRSRYIRIRGS
jgi:hypothetical protein